MMYLSKSYLLGVLSVAMLLSPFIVIAESPSNATEMPKEVWLQQVKMEVPEPVCKSFMEDESIAVQMEAHHINYEKCMALIPAIDEKCLQKYRDELPAIINHDSAEKWGRVLGECIGNDFAVNYLYSDVPAKDSE